MTNVACFCGREYSFDGDAGDCPQCGEIVALPGASVDRDEPDGRVPGQATRKLRSRARRGDQSRARRADHWFARGKSHRRADAV